MRFLKLAPTEQVDDAAILKAKEALEAGRISEEKDEQHDAKRNDMVRQQKIKNEEQLAQKTQKELTEKEEQAKKEKEKLEAEKSNDSKKSPKRLRVYSIHQHQIESSFTLLGIIQIENLRKKKEHIFHRKLRMSRLSMVFICQLSR